MKYCEHCGERIREDADVCVYCGRKVKDDNDDHGSFGWGLLSFMFPLLGIILWLVWRKDKPLRAKSCSKGVLADIIIAILCVVGVFLLI